MGQYTKNGLYNGYKKNNKERAELDYYATPPVETENILNVLQINFDHQTILEPCLGGGHMLSAILKYCDENNMSPTLIGTDFKDRGYSNERIDIQYNLDFLADDYPIDKADVVIMNPPYATLEPFLIRGLEIAQRYLIVLCRMQVIEGEGRYENIFKNNPPTYMYQYVNRIQCWKDGIRPSGSSSQGYCWLVWDKLQPGVETTLRWLKRSSNY